MENLRKNTKELRKEYLSWLKVERAEMLLFGSVIFGGIGYLTLIFLPGVHKLWVTIPIFFVVLTVVRVREINQLIKANKK